jgi:leucyl/phenylalanyl-tRNA--protein transferase
VKVRVKSRQLVPALLLDAYRAGYFPMAEPSTGVISWYSPDPRAIIPLESFRVTRSLRQKVRKQLFQVKVNNAFERVISLCADREETWISPEIISVYTELHRMGHAHSVESWYNQRLVGGLYGVAIGGAFFGESMFSTMTDSSKVALVHLVERLKQRSFRLLDTQYVNDHLKQFGVVEIPRLRYLKLLAEAISEDTRFAGSP